MGWGRIIGARVALRATLGGWLLSASMAALAQSGSVALDDQAAASEQTAPSPVGAPSGDNVQQAPESFPVYAIDVTGVTKLSPGEIERIVYNYTGPTKTNVDVENARAAIQDAYAAKGYEAVIVTLPQQDTELFQQGIITIAVSEAPVGEVRIADGRYHSGKAVNRALTSVKPGEPLNLKALQSEIDAANRYPDRQIAPVFVPGKEPGTLDVEFTVDSKLPLHASLELNNDNSPSTTRPRLSGTVKYSNLWNVGHTLSASFVVAPRHQDDSKVFSGSYTAPLLGTPWTFMVFGYKSNSNIAALGGSNVLGNGYQIGARAIYRLPSTSTNQTISFGADYKSFNQDILIGAANIASTPIRYAPLVLEYNLFARDDSSAFAKSVGVSDLSATIGGTFGLRAVKRNICVVQTDGQPCSTVDQFRNREIDSFENFVHFNAGLSYELTTKIDVVLASALSAQLADSHLVTNEQFAAGGQTSVRGYFQSEAVGDNGFTSSFEVRAPSLSPYLGKWVNELRLFGFADGGVVKLKRALPGQTDLFHLFGVGGGARIRLLDTFFGEMTLAYPLRAGPVTAKNDPRIVFVVRGEF